MVKSKLSDLIDELKNPKRSVKINAYSDTFGDKYKKSFYDIKYE